MRRAEDFDESASCSVTFLRLGVLKGSPVWNWQEDAVKMPSLVGIPEFSPSINNFVLLRGALQSSPFSCVCVCVQFCFVKHSFLSKLHNLTTSQISMFTSYQDAALLPLRGIIIGI